jgi:hypothetical protein
MTVVITISCPITIVTGMEIPVTDTRVTVFSLRASIRKGHGRRIA